MYRLLAGLLLLACVSPVWSQVPNVGLQRDHPLSRGLVSWYKAVEGFTGTNRFYDLMGRNHTTFVLNNGNAVWQIRPASPVGPRTLALVGTTTNPDYPAGTAFGMNVAHLTLAAWLYFDQATCEWSTVMSKGLLGNGADQDFSLGVNCDSAAILVEFNLSNSVEAFAGAVIPTQQWFHLAATYDGAARRVYLNGVLAGTLATTLAITNTYSTFRIGYHWYASWNGPLDDVRVYNRALSASEIALLAQRVPPDRGVQAQLRRGPPLAGVRPSSAGPSPSRGSFVPFFSSP